MVAIAAEWGVPEYQVWCGIAGLAEVWIAGLAENRRGVAGLYQVWRGIAGLAEVWIAGLAEVWWGSDGPVSLEAPALAIAWELRLASRA